MNDARAFTDYRPNCVVNRDLQHQSGTTLNNHEYRLWLQNNYKPETQCNAIAPVPGACCGCNAGKPVDGGYDYNGIPQSQRCSGCKNQSHKCHLCNPNPPAQVQAQGCTRGGCTNVFYR